MKTLGKKRKIESGKLFNAYFDAELYQVEIRKGLPFGRGWYDETVNCFEVNGKEYAVLGYDHFNGHFSGFMDRTAIFGIYIAKVN